MSREIRVALLGNPNSGKTTLFNALVGANQKVGNFPGVTIEKVEGKRLHHNDQITIIDLPGTYSLTAYSPEEVITRNFIIENQVDVIINVVDGTNLERNLFLTTQLMELGTKWIFALNMADEVEKNNITIDLKQLQTLLGTHIIPISAAQKTGLDKLLDHITRVYDAKIIPKTNKVSYRQIIEIHKKEITEILSQDTELAARYPINWLSIKLIENDAEVRKLLHNRPIAHQVKEMVIKCETECLAQTDTDPEMAVTEDRLAFVRGAVRETVQFPKSSKMTITDRIDAILINRILGVPILLAVMWLMFQLTFRLGNIPMHWMEKLFELIGQGISHIVPPGFLQSIIVNGIISGVGGVLIFLPNILILFMILAFLEGTGYMARAAFVIDKVMHHFGLHGRSFIPMVTGFGCSVPAFMATRILKSDSDRIVTMMIIPFMSCGAKLPVYVLLISAFFPSAMAGNVLFGLYLLGIIVALLSAKLLKKSLFSGESEPFVMELPPYRMPSLKSILMQAQWRASMYIKKAGTIILCAAILIWLGANYPHNKALDHKINDQIRQITITQTLTPDQKASAVTALQAQNSATQLRYSCIGRIGKCIEPLISPLGLDWKIGIALTTGLAAKEIIVSTLGTIYALDTPENTKMNLAQRIQADPAQSIPSALSLMVFVLLYIPCIAATTVFHKEAGSWKWTLIYAAYSMTTAWLMAFLVYHIARLWVGTV